MPKVCIGQFPVKRPDRIVWNTGGKYVTQEYRGPRNLIEGLVPALAASFETIELDHNENNLISIVRATTRAPTSGETESPVANFELSQSEQNIDLLFHSTFAGLSSAEGALVQKGVDEKMNADEFSDAWDAAVATSGSGVSSGNKATAILLLYRRNRGQDNFRVYGWQFTINLNVSKFFPTAIDFTGHGFLWTNAQVNALANLYGGIPNFALPSYSETAAQTAAALAYRWYRNVSSVQLSSRGSFNLTMGWELALWDTLVYAAY